MTDHAFGCQCRGHVNRPWDRSEHWSGADVAYLEARFGRAPDAALSRKLGRSVVGLRLKAKRLGLRKRDAGYTARDVAKLFGVDSTTVADSWIARGLLSARRAWRQGLHPVYLVSDAGIERFIAEHPEYLDVTKMPPSLFRDLAARDPWLAMPEAHRLTGRNPHAIVRMIQAGTIRGRRRGTHWYIPAADIRLIRPLASIEAIEDSYFRAQSGLDMRRRRRKGLLPAHRAAA